MKPFILSYFVFLLVFVVADFIWLARAGDTIYRPAMGDMVLAGFRPWPALVFYLIYALGVVCLAVLPGGSPAAWQAAGLRGALFGLCAYATYDLTNQATLKHWSTMLSLIDMAWGSLLTGVGAAAAAAVVAALL